MTSNIEMEVTVEPEEGDGLHKKSKVRLITVEPVLLSFMFAQGIAYPAFQALVYQKVCLMYASFRFNNLEKAHGIDKCENLQFVPSKFSRRIKN